MLETEVVIAYPIDLTWTTGTPVPEGISEFPLASLANEQTKLDIVPLAILHGTPKKDTWMSLKVNTTELGLLRAKDISCPLSVADVTSTERLWLNA